MSFLDSNQRFLAPDFDNSSVLALSSVIKKLEFELPLPLVESKLISEKFREIKNNFSVKNIVLLLVDSLGTENIRETGILTNYLENNCIEVDCMFPSMTSTNMASLSHLSYPGNHGLVGYNIYHEKINKIFNALNCQTVSDNGKEVTLAQLDLRKEDIIAGPSLPDQILNHSTLCNQKINVEAWVPRSFDMTGLPRYLFGSISPYQYEDMNPREMLQNIYHDLFNSQDLNVFVVYFPHTDYTSHLYTAQSPQYLASMKLLETIIKALENHPTVGLGETAIVVTSDHGQVTLPKGDNRVAVSKKDVYYHNFLGFSIGTSGRALHVYYDSEKGERNAEEYLSQYFSNSKNGIILDNNQASKLLGPKIENELYKKRLGEKVVLMDENFYLDYPEVVLYDGKEILGQHGGMTKREVKVPFFII